MTNAVYTKPHPEHTTQREMLRSSTHTTQKNEASQEYKAHAKLQFVCRCHYMTDLISGGRAATRYCGLGCPCDSAHAVPFSVRTGGGGGVRGQ